MMYEKLQSKDASNLENQSNLNHSQEQQEYTNIPSYNTNTMMRLQQGMGNMAMQHMLQSMFSESDDKEFGQVRDEMNEQESSPGNKLENMININEESQENHLEDKSISDILAMAPASSTRTRDEMERDIRLAQLTVDKVIAESTSLDEVSSYFPLLQLRFGLKNIEIQGAGTPIVQVAMEINPKAACLIKNPNEFTLNKGDSHGLSDKQDVTFKTGTSSSGHTWATEMTASQLGPNHPRGFGPTEQRALMRHLPTNRKNHPGLANRYIRGHLLNDSLGGPGVEQNMFPITERANKDHENYVESTVKHWVNNLGYFVYYHVEVKNIRETLDVSLYDDAKNYVDAELHCEAYVLSVDGNRSKLNGYIHRIIKSEHGVHNKVEDMQEKTLRGIDKPDTSHKKIVNNGLVELSETKDKSEKGFDNVISEVEEEIAEFFEECKLYFRNDTNLYSVLAQLIEPSLNSVSIEKLKFVFQAIVAHSNGDKQKFSNLQKQNFDAVGSWNHITNELGKRKDAISNMLDKFSKVIVLYNDMQDGEKKWLCECEYNCRDGALFDRMLREYLVVDNTIAKMRVDMYNQGWQDARHSIKDRGYFDAEFYRESYELYMSGLTDAQSSNDKRNDNEAYVSAYDEYRNGLEDARKKVFIPNGVNAYIKGGIEFQLGRSDASTGRYASSNNFAYMEGYHSKSTPRKKLRLENNDQLEDQNRMVQIGK